MTIEIQQARPSDAPLVEEILVEAATWVDALGVVMWEEGELVPESIAAEIAAGQFFIAQVDGDPAGVIRFQLEDRLFWPDLPQGESAFVHRLAVRRRYKGQGVSNALLAWSVNRARDLGKRHLRLDCDESRPKLRALYERFGFRFHSFRHVGAYYVARYEVLSRLMTFPVWIDVGPWRLHPHVVLETLAYVTGFLAYLVIRDRRGDRISNANRWSVLTATIVGAAIGSRLLAWIDATPAGGVLDAFGGKTIVGGLLGGWLATELQKARLGIRESTGNLYVFPLVIGIAFGRIGCFLSGLPDGTYGVATMMPWGVDFGDGVSRHPTALYESLFALALGFGLYRIEARLAPGQLFRVFMLAYLGFRVIVDTIKPGVAIAFGLTTIQWACVAGVLYCGWLLTRERAHVALRGT